MPVVRAGRARLITAPEYRVAKQGAEYAIKSQWKGQPMTVPVELVALVYVPDRRVRDNSNLSKLLLDSMSGIVYVDDSQVEDERWIKAGIDRENPRVEITVTPRSDVNGGTLGERIA